MPRQITLALTNYNRGRSLIAAFERVVHDKRIREVVISDDHSDPSFMKLILLLLPNSPKIRIKRQHKNLGMQLNKAEAINISVNSDWVCIFDSDNVMDKSYIDALFKIKQWDARTIYVPSGALPDFNYSKYAGMEIDKSNVKRYLNEPMFECMLNTCNYVVNREAYLQIFKGNPEIRGTDTLWFNYLWLKAGNSFTVVDGMTYKHTVHSGSEFLKHVDYNMTSATKIKQLIKQL